MTENNWEWRAVKVQVHDHIPDQACILHRLGGHTWLPNGCLHSLSPNQIAPEAQAVLDAAMALLTEWDSADVNPSVQVMPVIAAARAYRATLPKPVDPNERLAKAAETLLAAAWGRTAVSSNDEQWRELGEALAAVWLAREEKS